MQAQGPTSWLLNGRVGWRSAGSPDPSTTAGERSGIRLGASPTGPLALDSADGSLGGLRLPQGLALDADGRTYLLRRAAPWVLRFDPAGRGFRPLPLGGAPTAAADPFMRPLALAAAGSTLYLADQETRRVWAFDQHSLGIRRVWRLVEPAFAPVGAQALDERVLRYVFLTDPEAAAQWLQGRADAFARFLVEQFTPAKAALLAEYAPGTPVSAALRDALETALETLVQGPSLYAPERLKRVRLSAATRALLALPTTPALERELNRRLLEEASHGAIDTRAWLPADLVARGERVYILDRRYGRVYTHTVGSDDLQLVVDQPAEANRWSRLAVDDAGRIYLLAGAGPAPPSPSSTRRDGRWGWCGTRGPCATASRRRQCAPITWAASGCRRAWPAAATAASQPCPQPSKTRLGATRRPRLAIRRPWSSTPPAGRRASTRPSLSAPRPTGARAPGAAPRSTACATSASGTGWSWSLARSPRARGWW
jgi:hypothetical protein